MSQFDMNFVLHILHKESDDIFTTTCSFTYLVETIITYTEDPEFSIQKIEAVTQVVDTIYERT